MFGVVLFFFFFFQAEDGIRDTSVTGVQTCALPILIGFGPGARRCSLIARPADRLGFGGYAWSNAGGRTDYLPEIDTAWLGRWRRHRGRGAWNRRYLHEQPARGRRCLDRYGRRLGQSGRRWRRSEERRVG